MNYLLEGFGAAVWVIIIIKAWVELRHTIHNYNDDRFVGNSIIRTHQNLSGLIFILAAAISTLLATIQFHAVWLDLDKQGLWVTALLIRLMFLYQVEMYSQERTTVFTRVGIIKMFTIKFKRQKYEQIDPVDKDK